MSTQRIINLGQLCIGLGYATRDAAVQLVHVCQQACLQSVRHRVQSSHVQRLLFRDHDFQYDDTAALRVLMLHFAREQANLNIAHQLMDFLHGLTESKWALLHAGRAAYRRLHFGHRRRHDHAAAIQPRSPRGRSRLGHLCLLHLHERG